MAGALDGLRIVVPESRELDLFASLLERQGAATLRCPMVTIFDLADPAPAQAWLKRLADGAFDDVVLFTGEGLRRLMACAERAGSREAAVAGLARARKIVRGPKPVKALREIGLGADLSAAAPTSEGVVATLRDLDLSGRRVGLQAYPGQGREVETVLAERGAATIERIVPYRYASHEEDSAVAATIRTMAADGADLVAFTSRPQVTRLAEVAARHGLEAELAAAMARTRIAAVGPVVGRAVEAAGWQVAVAPDTSFHLKPMILAIAALFAGEPRRAVSRAPDRGTVI